MISCHDYIYISYTFIKFYFVFDITWTYKMKSFCASVSLGNSYNLAWSLHVVRPLTIFITDIIDNSLISFRRVRLLTTITLQTPCTRTPHVARRQNCASRKSVGSVDPLSAAVKQRGMRSSYGSISSMAGKLRCPEHVQSSYLQQLYTWQGYSKKS